MTSPVVMSRFDWRAKGVPAAGLMLRVTSRFPKRRLKAICCSSSSGWPRKSSTGMLLEGGADLRPRRIGKRPCDVGAVDPGGEARSEATDRDRHRATPKAATQNHRVISSPPAAGVLIL